jgi:hypothetical protein
MGSTRHKALADLADLEAERFFTKLFPDKKIGEFSSTEVKVCLIEETMRQRINELPGYASELKQAVDLHYQLGNAIYLTGDVRTNDAAKREKDLRISNGKFPKEIDFLQQIKKQAIAKKKSATFYPTGIIGGQHNVEAN